MPMAAGSADWVDGNLYVYDKNGATIFYVDFQNRKVVFHASAGLDIPLHVDATDIAAGAVTAGKVTLTAGNVLVGTKTTNLASALDMSAKGAIPVGQGAGETPAAKTLSNDVTMDETGSVTIAAKAVEAAMVSMTAGNVFVGTKTSNAASLLDISAKGAIPVGQGAGETPLAVTLSGDVTMNETGAVTIAAKAVENTMVALAAGTVLVGTKTSGDGTALDISAKGAFPVGQGAGETAAAKTMSGDVTMDETGAVTIAADSVERSMLAAVLRGSDGAKTAAAGLTVEERGIGHFKTTILTFTNVDVALLDSAGVVAYGGLQVYDFPQGYIYIQSAVADFAVTKSSAGVNVDWDGDFGVGTAAASNDAGPLAATEANIIPNTATPQAVAGVTTADAVSTASEHAIHDGTGVAIDAFINLLVDDADHDVAGTPCNLILNGTLTMTWIFMGDN